MTAVLRIKIIVLVISLLFLPLPGVAMAQGVSDGERNSETLAFQDDHSTYVPNYIPVNLNLKENNGLSPEVAPPDTTDSAAVCPNGYDPIWVGRFFRYGPTNWRDVGTWETRKVGKDLQATGVIRFRIWISFLGSASPSVSEFEFNWWRNEEIIASTTVEQNIRTGMDPALIDTQGNLINQTPFQAGDIFKLQIRCRINQDGARILYGSQAHDSHVQMTCDPLDLLHVQASKNGIKGLYADVFRVRFNEMTFIGKVDQQIIITPPQFGVEAGEHGTFNYVTWDMKLEPDTYEVEIGIAYVPNDNTSMVFRVEQIKIQEKKEPTWFGLPVRMAQMIIALVILVIVLAIIKVVHNKIQERRWMREMEESEK
jgi:hypothetical protein